MINVSIRIKLFLIIEHVNLFCKKITLSHIPVIRVICVYSENKMETDPRREYDTLEDVAESAAYEIPG